ENEPSFATINVDDRADGGNRTVFLDNFIPAGDTEFGRLTGLAPAPITFECADTQDVNIRTGAGTVVANVLSTCPIRGALTLFGNSLATTVNVGSGGSVQNIRGRLRIENEPSFTTVNVNDQSGPGNRTVTIDNFTPAGDSEFGRIRGLAPAE